MAKAIQVENLSKQYRLGQIGTGSLVHDVNRWWHSVRGKEDPYLKIGEANDRTTKGSSDYVWSLRDVDFDIEQGDSVGIIGRNGAGKSTLLKILSRVTAPTTGSVKVKGRIASLLEVGTGFHPDLSGKDNIYLNGAILGMRKGEIARKFDEIVDFAGVERYIDTPVKRYSSGMYVRLAFAVAAHLESETLIVDEVLAVGDAEFQKKCLGKMNQVSKGEGRTVLFVSHNMTAMSSLCEEVVYLQQGKVICKGKTNEVIPIYLKNDSELKTKRIWKSNESPGDDAVKLLATRLADENGYDIDNIDFYKGGYVEFTFEVLKSGFCPIPNMHIFNQKGDHVLFCSDVQSDRFATPGIYRTSMEIPSHFLNEGRYLAGLAATTMIPEKVHFYEQESLIFDVIEDMNLRIIDYRGKLNGVVRPNFKWTTNKVS